MSIKFLCDINLLRIVTEYHSNHCEIHFNLLCTILLFLRLNEYILAFESYFIRIHIVS